MSDDCKTVWIGEQLTEKVRKANKTNKARTITVPVKVQAMLLARRRKGIKPNDLVFQSPVGGPIQVHNFQCRAWKTVLKNAGVTYRKPYTTRSTMSSYCLEAGVSPLTVACLVGNSPEVIYRFYAGHVSGAGIVPELF